MPHLQDVKETSIFIRVRCSIETSSICIILSIRKLQSGIIHPILSPNPSGKTPTYCTLVLSQELPNYNSTQKKIGRVASRSLLHSSISNWYLVQSLIVCIGDCAKGEEDLLVI
jgi:hypothetical protein